MSVVRFPSPETIESHAELMRQASMEPEKKLDDALNEIHAAMEQFRTLRGRMTERLQHLNEGFQSSMARRTQLDLKISEIESKQDQENKMAEKYEQYIRRLKNEPEPDQSFPSWTNLSGKGAIPKQTINESDLKSSPEGLHSKETKAPVDWEKELRETVKKLTEVSIFKEKLEAQKKELRVEIDKEDSIKEFFLVRIKRIQEPIKKADQLFSSIEKDLSSSDEAVGTAKRLAERLLWLGMKLSQLSDAVEELRRGMP